jgi:hypothetical protein
VTDFSSKGLLPQLIDVLNALTEGQELLSRKVREARLEHYGHMEPVADGRRQSEKSHLLTLRTFVGTGSDASIGTRKEPPSDRMEIGADLTSVDGYGHAPWLEPSSRASAAPDTSTVPEATSPPNLPAVIATYAATPADVPSETSVQTDWPDPAPPSETTPASLNRDYNFFDELDARLAGLQNPTDRSEE